MNLCIVGTGYVGLVSAACFAEMGNDVCCVDSNPTIVENLRIGKVHIYEPGLDELVKRNVAEGRLRFTTQVSEGMGARCGQGKRADPAPDAYPGNPRHRRRSAHDGVGRQNGRHHRLADGAGRPSGARRFRGAQASWMRLRAVSAFSL